jgi:hypothetical protein
MIHFAKNQLKAKSLNSKAAAAVLSALSFQLLAKTTEGSGSWLSK